MERRSKRRLKEDDVAAIVALPIRARSLTATEYFTHEGDRTYRCAYLLEGALYQTKLTGDGARQIVGIRLQHEFVGLPSLLLDAADHDVQALGPCRLLEVNSADLRAVIKQQPNIGEILLADAMICCAIAQDWIVNIGRRDARSRVAHLLCELALRIEGSALSSGATYVLPFCQQQLGDALGLGRVAVNRALRDLARENIVSSDKHCITILNSDKLEKVGDFTARYLHLGQSGRDRRQVDRAAAPARSAFRSSAQRNADAATHRSWQTPSAGRS